ncbi:uncharacterized protein B0H18DRAFT_1121010 [Fomitopsis serialis]|uniref:uncharacterized protein n=1 Tax=Fomitopsis serialis TaxID=139415 RepID=UPI002007DB93|nr:uncharacterized protein B0H18DRAFT_1121010 [Neoantrodia serialis]KAH9922185.1 hypothetical protein B0H18DRAFT_1121010 [Neoantrodia serialis]
MDHAQNFDTTNTSIPAEDVLFIGAGTFTVGKSGGNQCTDWASGVITLIQVEGPSKVALFLVDASNRKHSFISEVSCDWALALIDERNRLFGWTIGEMLFRVHLQDNDRRRFLSLVRSFTLALDSVCTSTQNTQDRLQSYLEILPSDLTQLQPDAIVNCLGRLERLKPEPMNPNHFGGCANEETHLHGYPQSPDFAHPLAASTHEPEAINSTHFGSRDNEQPHFYAYSQSPKSEDKRSDHRDWLL